MRLQSAVAHARGAVGQHDVVVVAAADVQRPVAKPHLARVGAATDDHRHSAGVSMREPEVLGVEEIQAVYFQVANGLEPRQG